MKHRLTDDHKAHLSKLGMAGAPGKLEIDEKEYAECYQLWARSCPGRDHDFLHQKVIGHVAWKRRTANAQAPAVIGGIATSASAASRKWELRVLIVLLALLILLLLAVWPAHAQFSKINTIQFQQGGAPVAGGFFASPFNMNCLGTLTCTASGATISLSAGGGGAVAWSAITAPVGPLGLAHAAFTTTFTWNAATGAGVNLFTFTDTLNNTGTGILFRSFTASGSAATPWQADANGIGWKVGTTGLLLPVSTANLAIPGTSNGVVISRGAAAATTTTGAGIAGQALLSNGPGVDPSFADPVVSQPTASLLNAQVVGNAASAAADSGNPVKTGTVFNTTQPTVTTGQRVDAQGTARGALIVATGVDAFAANASQAGTWTVQPGNTANTTAWKVDGSAVTQPISAASLPLPTGASTAAKQPALGTAGTASADVITVQGIAGMTKLLVTPDSVALPANQSVNVAQINGITPLMGNGVTGTGSPRVTIASDNTAFPVNSTLSAETTKVIGTVRVQGNVGGVLDAAGQNVASPANELLVAAQFNTTPTTLTTGNVSPLQMDSAGNLLVNIKAGAAAGGTSSNFAAAFPSAGTAGGLKATAAAPTYVEGNMQAFSSDLGGLLRTRCDVGCAGGSTTPADAFANPTTTGLQFDFLAGFNGTTWDRLRSTITNGLQVDVTRVQGTVDVSDRVARLVGQVEGRAASGVAKAGNPIQIGGVFNTTQPTVTTGQAVEAQLTARGGQIVSTGADTFNVTVNAALPTGANTIGALTANQSVNVAQINAVTPLMGNGVTGTGSQRVTIASDNTAFPVNATLSAETTKVIGTVRAQGNLGAAFDAATGAAPPVNAILDGGLTSGATGGFVTAIPICDSFVNVNVSTATTTLLITGVAARHVRICSFDLMTAGANNVALLSGTGATCATGTTGMNGGITAASGWNFAANQGMTQGSGLGTINRTNATGDSVCVITSAATQLSGRFAYAIY